MWDLFQDLRDVSNSHNSARLNINRPVEEVAEEFRDQGVRIGGSFSPETYEQFDIWNNYQQLDALKLIIEELNVKYLRFSINWDKVLKEDGSVNLEFYREYLDYATANNVNLTLNIGPIKVMRWPEVHLPEKYSKRLKENPNVTLD